MAIIALQKEVSDQLYQEAITGLESDHEVQQLEMSIDKDQIVKNEQLIMSFLPTLAALLPGVLGKVLGQALIVAAKAWFNANRDSSGRSSRAMNP